MLKLAQDGETASSIGLRWLIHGKDLLGKAIRAPQGFSYDIYENIFWTTNELAAYLFYKRYKLASEEVLLSFESKVQADEELYKLSSSTDSDKNFKCLSGMEYSPHQKSGIEYILKAQNVLIGDEPRVGKTILTCGYINQLPKLKNILICCPKTAKGVWSDEGQKWLIDDYKIQVLASRDLPWEDTNIFITNYDNLHVQRWLLKKEWDLIVADEIHQVCHLNTRRARYFFALKSKQRLGLTGTPVLNRPEDFLTILQWIDPKWKEFYLRKDKIINNTGISLNLEEVQELARSSCMLRRVQAQVFSNEPSYKRIVSLKPSPEIEALLAVERDEGNRLFETYRRVNNLQFNDYSRARRELGIHKIPYALSHLDVYSDVGDKVVAFAYHREVIEKLTASLGSKAVSVYGGTSEEDRARAIERFKNDPDCRVFVGSIISASMAINLAVANHIVFVECDWRHGLMAQAEERCSEKAKKHQVLIEYLCFEGSLDQNILSKVEYKDKRATLAEDILYE